MSAVIPETLLDELRALATELVADPASDARTIEVLGREATRGASGQRVPGEWEVLTEYTGTIVVRKREDLATVLAGDRPTGRRKVEITLPYDADLTGAKGFRIKGTDTIYEPLAGQNNLDSSFRVTTVVRAQEHVV